MCRGAAKGSSAVTATSRRQEAGLRQRRRHGRDVAGGHEAHGRTGGKETLLGEDARVAPAGKKPGLSRLPRPDGAGPRRAASLRSPASPPTPPPHRYSPPAPRGPRRAAHAPSAPHHAPEKAAIFAHSPAAHSLRPSLPPRRRARDAGGASFRSAPFGVPTPGGDADPGQRFRERKDSPVCLHNAAVL